MPGSSPGASRRLDPPVTLRVGPPVSPRGAHCVRLGRRGTCREQQIGEPQQQAQLGAALGQPPMPHLGVADVALHVQERMLDLRPGRGLALLRLDGGAAGRQAPPLPRPQRHLPVDPPASRCSGCRATPS